MSFLCSSFFYFQADGSLFSQYISKFFLEKLKSSGIPIDFQNNVQEYVDGVNEKYGTQLHAGDFVYNRLTMYCIILDMQICFFSGKRLISKSLLNILWGRYSVRPDTSKAEIVSKLERIVKLFTSGNTTIYGMKKITDAGTYVMVHKTNDDFGKETVRGTSLMVGIITTRF